MPLVRKVIQFLYDRTDLRKGPYLIFDSNFDSGNLDKAIAKSEIEYNLYLCSDTNSPNRCQWFYFCTTNMVQGSTVKFNIVNMTKYPYFIKDGMKPLSFSEKEYRSIYLSWNSSRIDNVALTKGTVKVSSSRLIKLGENYDNETKEAVCPYILSFTYKFKYDDDKVYFSFVTPYPYTCVKNFLNSLRVKGDIIYKRDKLCNSLLGVPVDILTITSTKRGLREKTYIVITARMHSAETAGSCKVQGIIKFLLSSDPIAESLRYNHIFLIVPLINPDGVIFGNNRCSITGNDMNRCWGNPNKLQEPIIYRLKAELSEIYKLGKNQILIFCDLHGHSRFYNSFMFACHKGTGTLCSWTKARLLPRILAKRCYLFNYHFCSFKVEPRKASTARIIVWKEFKVVNSFTLESSQYAYDLGNEVVRFTERDYTMLAEFLMFSFDEYRKLLIGLQNELRTGWLKPCQLKKLTGVPAADLLRKEIEEEKANLKKLDRLNKSDTGITKPNFNVKASTNLPNIEKTRTLFMHKEITDIARSNSVQRNVKKSSWKDYFTDAELTEINKPTILEPIIESKGLSNKDSEKKLVRRESSLRTTMVLVNEKGTELFYNKTKNNGIVQEQSKYNTEIGLDKVALVDEKKSYGKKALKRLELTSFRNELKGTGLRGMLAKEKVVDRSSEFLNSRNVKKTVSAIKSREAAYKTEESSCERTLQTPWLTISIDKKLNIRGIGEQRMSSGLFSRCKQYPIANNLSEINIAIDQKKSVIEKKDKRNAHSKC